jgi:hypothetical protein
MLKEEWAKRFTWPPVKIVHMTAWLSRQPLCSALVKLIHKRLAPLGQQLGLFRTSQKAILVKELEPVQTAGSGGRCNNYIFWHKAQIVNLLGC